MSPQQALEEKIEAMRLNGCSEDDYCVEYGVTMANLVFKGIRTSYHTNLYYGIAQNKFRNGGKFNKNESI